MEQITLDRESYDTLKIKEARYNALENSKVIIEFYVNTWNNNIYTEEQKHSITIKKSNAIQSLIDELETKEAQTRAFEYSNERLEKENDKLKKLLEKPKFWDYIFNRKNTLWKD